MCVKRSEGRMNSELVVSLESALDRLQSAAAPAVPSSSSSAAESRELALLADRRKRTSRALNRALLRSERRAAQSTELLLAMNAKSQSLLGLAAAIRRSLLSLLLVNSILFVMQLIYLLCPSFDLYLKVVPLRYTDCCTRRSRSRTFGVQLLCSRSQWYSRGCRANWTEPLLAVSRVLSVSRHSPSPSICSTFSPSWRAPFRFAPSLFRQSRHLHQSRAEQRRARIELPPSRPGTSLGTRIQLSSVTESVTEPRTESAEFL